MTWPFYSPIQVPLESRTKELTIVFVEVVYYPPSYQGSKGINGKQTNVC